jgi:hypothetical protein
MFSGANITSRFLSSTVPVSPPWPKLVAARMGNRFCPAARFAAHVFEKGFFGVTDSAKALARRLF